MDGQGFDEVAELYFENAEDLETATSPESWQRATADAGRLGRYRREDRITLEDNRLDFRPLPPNV